MQIHDPEQTARLLPYPALALAIEAMLAELRAGTAFAPGRIALPVGCGADGSALGTLLVMPARGRDLGICKTVTLHDGNPARGLPNLQGEVLVFDAATGVRLALVDGPALTGRRTAAVSLLAAQRFAPRPDGALLVVGAGAQALTHLEAFAAGLGTRRVFIHSRSRDKAAALAGHARSLGLDAEIVDRADEALPEVGLVVTATTSRAPILPDLNSALWRDDHFIAAVGAFRPEMCELPPSLCLQAAANGRLVADTFAGLEHEAGDLLQAGVDWRLLREFKDAVLDADRVRGGDGRGPVVFKSVGYALRDLAAASLIVKGSAP
jgi:ornithine cyclodeaminase